jgi:peptidoglycan/LPS O-acetylase OafA/YrhL
MHSAPSIPVGGRTGFNPVLDGVRGLAIALVLACHMTILENMSNPLDHFVSGVTFLGWTGVDLFFVLSGFLITGILWDAKERAHYFRNFYARRVLRIFPLYYLMLLVCFVLIPLVLPHVLGRVFSPSAAEHLQAKIGRYVEATEYQGWFWTYLCNIAMAIQRRMLGGVLQVCWSLAIEEQFYIVWPLIVFMCGRRALMRVCAGLVVFSLLFRVATELILPLRGCSAGETYVVTYVTTLSRMDGLGAGALLAMLVRGPGADIVAMARVCRPMLLVCAPLAIIIAVADTLNPAYNREVGPQIGQTPVFQTVGLTLTVLSFASLLVLALGAPAGSGLNRFFTSRPLRTLGKYAYAMYLFHFAVRAIVAHLIISPSPTALFHFPTTGGSQIVGQLIYWPLSVGLTFVAAWISWRVFEGPILKLKRLFPSSPELARGAR